MTISTSNPAKLRAAKWHAIAEKIAANPSLLEIPLANISRWLAKGQDAPQMLEAWRDRITAAQESNEAFAALLALLRSDTEDAQHLKSYSPFPGILTSEEVDRYTCAYQH